MSRLDALLDSDRKPAQPCDYVIVKNLLPEEEQEALYRMVFEADPRRVHASAISRIVRQLGTEMHNEHIALSPGVIGRHRRKDCLFCNEQRADTGQRNGRGQTR
jgi:hypothetical protein